MTHYKKVLQDISLEKASTYNTVLRQLTLLHFKLGSTIISAITIFYFQNRKFNCFMVIVVVIVMIIIMQVPEPEPPPNNGHRDYLPNRTTRVLRGHHKQGCSFEEKIDI